MTILVTGYASKKALKAAIGQKLQYRETSLHGDEYKSSGSFTVAHRPSLPECRAAGGREFFARVTMGNNIIEQVE